MDADILIKNARILPMTAPETGAEALATAAGRILAIGSEKELAAVAGPETDVIDAAGGTVLPGFIESHMHLLPGAFSLRFLHLSEAHRLSRGLCTGMPRPTPTRVC